MQYRVLGRTGIQVSAVSFGTGPVSGLMTGDDPEAQRATAQAAIEAGINWFDTAPGYGQGQSEASLGRALCELGAHGSVHIATKVRLPPDGWGNTYAFVHQSVEESLRRLKVSHVTLLQLHNGITARRGDEPSSLCPADVLGPGGVAEAFRRLREEGLIGHAGLTGTGQPGALREVIRSGAFDTVQVPYNLLNPTAGSAKPGADGDADYGNILADCAELGLGVFAIRVFAGGALLGQPPSAHTLKTPYFPLALYQRDSERARRIQEATDGRLSMGELAVRFVLSHPAVSSALIGFGSPRHVAEVASFALEPLAVYDAIEAASSVEDLRKRLPLNGNSAPTE